MTNLVTSNGLYFVNECFFYVLFSGTGKTYTGIKLLYLFNQINKNLHREGSDRKQVLFCGPSNKSVDLVASMSASFL